MSAGVLSRVRTWIASSDLGEGARLPAERDLCATLGISRAELRKALLVLEANGNLTREIGRGPFLARKPGRGKSVGLRNIIDELAERTGPHEAMMARMALEPELARMAALNASPRQLRELRRLADTMRRAPSWLAYEEADSEFHDIVAAASGNPLLHELHRIMNGVRFVVVWRRLNTNEVAPGPDYHSFAEHDSIIAGLEARDPGGASRAMRAHLQGTLQTMAEGPAEAVAGQASHQSDAD
jgi:DNA-binding FadR family transcriptional regulator